MKCEAIQRRLLYLDDPCELPVEIRDHLVDCPCCQAWHDQLGQIESHVPFLPIPRSRVRDRFVLQFQLESTKTSVATNGAHRPTIPIPILQMPGTNLLAGGRFKIPRRIAVGMMATVCSIAVVIWAFALKNAESSTDAAPAKHTGDTFLAALVRSDTRLGQAETPRERIEILSEMAQDLNDEGRTLAWAKTTDELAQVAELYEEVVRHTMVKLASEIARSDRRVVLVPLAERLERSALTLDRLIQRVDTEQIRALRQMAAAARDGTRELRALVNEEKP